jgi:hypothetical protein
MELCTRQMPDGFITSFFLIKLQEYMKAESEAYTAGGSLKNRQFNPTKYETINNSFLSMIKTTPINNL